MADASKRSVRFPDDDNLCRYHAGLVLDEFIENRKNVWYNRNELGHIKRKAMVVSRESQRYGFSSLLTNTYGHSGPDVQESLNTWSRSASSRRGLERYINDEYAAKRSDLRSRTQLSVIRVQSKLRQDDANQVDHCWDILARLSETFSKDSANFARSMGRADEKATQADEPEDRPSTLKVRRSSRTSSRTLHVNSSSGVKRIPLRNLGLASVDMRQFY
jgi:hypothetical protein